MCIAILTKPGIVVSDDHLKNSQETNPDGCGLAWVQPGGKLKVFKTLDFAEFKRVYAKVCAKFPESNKLIHFRIRTHGNVDVQNCHPFVVDKDHAFIHNGTITMTAPSDKAAAYSDTFLFNKHILQNINLNIPNWMTEYWIKAMLQKMIDHSKIVVLRSDNNVLIVNEDKGHWLDDVWYSNYSYKASKATYSYGGKGKEHQNNKDWRKQVEAERKFRESVPGATHVLYGYDDIKMYAARWNREKCWNEVYDAAYNAWRKWSSIDKMIDFKWERDNGQTPVDRGLVYNKPTSKPTNVIALPFHGTESCEMCGDKVFKEDLQSVETAYGTLLMCKGCKSIWKTGMMIGG